LYCNLVAIRFDLLVPAKQLAGKIVSKTTCNVSSETGNPAITDYNARVNDIAGSLIVSLTSL